MLSTGEEVFVIAMYEESKQELFVLLEQEQIEKTEVNEALKRLSYHNDMQPI
ncbi:hypothetical protein [Bacillus tropicus]|nr:hypothetical protein [Bacillus tropicus]MEC2921292.1 hypothetical protein [Bacillus tropicus]MEC2956091.1 hypothetical protein [Bacillus tropicus]MEC3051293.1 hypothetical protein [Bacillus tropicus]MEC3077423.1 hypothetical protein [Bacillus tropicus]MEC3108793.1 hypothetical protein [Bacillus tropicus]